VYGEPIAQGKKGNVMKVLRAENPTSTKKARLYYLDWLRVLAVLGVFFVHCSVIFSFLPWQIKNAENSLVPTIFVAFLILWGMPLFFLLAGASASFGLRSRTGGQFLAERFIRLVIPFVVGFIFLSPLLAYFEGRNHLTYRGSLLQMYPTFFARIQFMWSSQWLGQYGYHLWFLAFLFFFCLLALPLFLYLKRDPGQRWLMWIVGLCERPGGSLLFVVPIFLIQLALRVRFPGYQDWADFSTWFAFFVLGYVLVSHPRFQPILEKQWKLTLCLGIACSLAITAFYGIGWVQVWETTPSYSAGYISYLIIRTAAAWSWVTFLFALGSRFFTSSNNLLHYANEAVLPFYLLHFPVIVIIAFYVVQWNASILVKFLVITTSALLATLALYDLLIRRLPFLRWAFGMKPPQKEELL